MTGVQTCALPISKIPALLAVFLIQKEAAALSVSLRKKTEIAA